MAITSVWISPLFSPQYHSKRDLNSGIGKQCEATVKKNSSTSSHAIFRNQLALEQWCEEKGGGKNGTAELPAVRSRREGVCEST